MLKYLGLSLVYSARSRFGGSVNITIVARLGPARGLPVSVIHYLRPTKISLYNRFVSLSEKFTT